MKRLVNEVSPRSGENKICTWCFRVGVRITGHNVVVHGVIGGIVADHQVTTSINVDSARIAKHGVTVNAASPAGNMDAGAVTGANTVSLANVIIEPTAAIYRDAIAGVRRGSATGNCTPDRGENPNAGIAACVTVSNRARRGGGNPACPIFRGRATGNKRSVWSSYAGADIKVSVTIDHR